MRISAKKFVNIKEKKALYLPDIEVYEVEGLYEIYLKLHEKLENYINSYFIILH